MLLASIGCEVRGVEDDQEQPPETPVVVPVDGEPLGGSISATFEGKAVSLRYGVALPLDADVALGVVDIRLSVQPVNCNADFQDGENFIVLIELPAPELGTYDETPIAFRRWLPGISDRTALGSIELTRHDAERVAGRVTWEHRDATRISGDFEVTRCPKPAPKPK
jgi:hypothetical protein